MASSRSWTILSNCSKFLVEVGVRVYLLWILWTKHPAPPSIYLWCTAIHVHQQVTISLPQRFPHFCTTVWSVPEHVIPDLYFAILQISSGLVASGLVSDVTKERLALAVLRSVEIASRFSLELLYMEAAGAHSPSSQRLVPTSCEEVPTSHNTS